MEASAGYKKTSGKFALKISKGALLAGRTYEFTVVVALKANSLIKTTVKTSVEVEWSPLQPAIVGGMIGTRGYWNTDTRTLSTSERMRKIVLRERAIFSQTSDFQNHFSSLNSASGSLKQTLACLFLHFLSNTGDRTVGRGSGKLRLDAKSSTQDPDNADGDFFCSWTCYDKSIDQPCYSAVTRQQKIVFPNDCIIEIDSEHFQADKTYKIT